MSRTLVSKKLFAGAAPVAFLTIFLAAHAWAQGNQAAQPYGQPSTVKGDWPMYFADPSGSRYSPLDQINASNFSKLEVAWHFKTDALGAKPEYKLEGTPLEINGHGLYYRRFAPRRGGRWTRAPANSNGCTASTKDSARRWPRASLSGRGVSYWTDGASDERIIFITTGYRLVELNAKDGKPITSFADNGINRHERSAPIPACRDSRANTSRLT